MKQDIKSQKELVEKLENKFANEVKRLEKMVEKADTKEKKQFLKGLSSGVRQAILLLPIAFDENGNAVN